MRCNSIIELGTRDLVSTWGLLHGLKRGSSYTGIDLVLPEGDALLLAQEIATNRGIDFNFIVQNDLSIDPSSIGEVDMIFIDALHTYAHVTCELHLFAPLAKRYLVLHDTSWPWGVMDDFVYSGNRSEYPEWVNKTKRGIWPAITDFLQLHQTEWYIRLRRTNNNGFTVLERVQTKLTARAVTSTSASASSIPPTLLSSATAASISISGKTDKLVLDSISSPSTVATTTTTTTTTMTTTEAPPMAKKAVFLIVDDSAQAPSDQILCFSYLFHKLLAPGGTFYIENVEASYQTEQQQLQQQHEQHEQHDQQQQQQQGTITASWCCRCNNNDGNNRVTFDSQQILSLSTMEVFKYLADDVNYESMTGEQREKQNLLLDRLIPSYVRFAVSTITFAYNSIIIVKKTQEDMEYSKGWARYR